MVNFRIVAKGDEHARAGVLVTDHGEVPTPTYMPVGTYGPVRLLDAEELHEAGATMVLGNALHLEQTIGSKAIEGLGGLARFTGWKGPTLTDSGGYQVSYMWRSGTHSLENGVRAHSSESPIRKITDEGAKVRSLTTGETYLLSPERAMEIQAAIGADVVMAFDQPTFDTDSLTDATTSLVRAHDWIRRSKVRWDELSDEGATPPGQMFFPIIQGGRFSELRRSSAQFSVDLDTPGIAIAGESIGIDPAVSAETINAVRDLLPEEKPLYAMGLGGGPEGFLEAAACGMDMFDNTSPTRMARCGLALLYPADGGTPKNKFRTNLKAGRHQTDQGPISVACRCKVCRTYSRAYVRHLLKIGEPLGMRLITFHNVFLMCDLGASIRAAIEEGTFANLKRSWLAA